VSVVKARKLRQSPTEAEKKLWDVLRHRQLEGFRFRRQHPIGKFIADFACTKYHLIIEADGGQHADNGYDVKRTAWLKSEGWHVIRFWNNDILENTDGVLEAILKTLNELEVRTLTPRA
jgi:very-short-patch-repair endonuclease